MLKKKRDNVAIDIGATDTPPEKEQKIMKKLKSIKNLISTRSPTYRLEFVGILMIRQDKKNAKVITKRSVNKLRKTKTNSTCLNFNILSSQFSKNNLHLYLINPNQISSKFYIEDSDILMYRWIRYFEIL